MITVALVLTVALGYKTAYFGPFFVVQLREAGYSYAEISQILLMNQLVNALLTPLWIVIPVAACYYFGKGYRLTLISAIVFFITMYVACTVGKTIGYIVYQIQAPNYPVLWSMLSQVFYLNGVFIWSLVGVLAGNYKREIEQKEAETYAC